jgi:hypothetical protein
MKSGFKLIVLMACHHYDLFNSRSPDRFQKPEQGGFSTNIQKWLEHPHPGRQPRSYHYRYI